MKKIFLTLLIMVGFFMAASAQVVIKARIGDRDHHRYHHYNHPVYHRRYYHHRRPGVIIRAHTSEIITTDLQKSEAVLFKAEEYTIG